jgi:competence protein ComGC
MRNSCRDQQGLTVLDAVITLVMIGLLIGVLIPALQRVAREAQETAIRAELVNIRIAISLFKTMNGRNPASLKELVEKDFMLPARIGSDSFSGSFFKQKYLMSNAVDAKGNIIDSFENPFFYDPKSGKVRSTTEGYERW